MWKSCGLLRPGHGLRPRARAAGPDLPAAAADPAPQPGRVRVATHAGHSAVPDGWVRRTLARDLQALRVHPPRALHKRRRVQVLPFVRPRGELAEASGEEDAAKGRQAPAGGSAPRFANRRLAAAVRRCRGQAHRRRWNRRRDGARAGRSYRRRVPPPYACRQPARPALGAEPRCVPPPPSSRLLVMICVSLSPLRAFKEAISLCALTPRSDGFSSAAMPSARARDGGPGRRLAVTRRHSAQEPWRRCVTELAPLP